MAKDKKKEVQRKETKEKMADGQKLSSTGLHCLLFWLRWAPVQA